MRLFRNFKKLTFFKILLLRKNTFVSRKCHGSLIASQRNGLNGLPFLLADGSIAIISTFIGTILCITIKRKIVSCGKCSEAEKNFLSNDTSNKRRKRRILIMIIVCITSVGFANTFRVIMYYFRKQVIVHAIFNVGTCILFMLDSVTFLAISIILSKLNNETL